MNVVILGEKLEIIDCAEKQAMRILYYQLQLLFEARLHDSLFRYSMVIMGEVLGLMGLLILNAPTFYFL